MKHHGHVSYTDVAKSIPFDNATNGFVSTDAQAAIEELKNAETANDGISFTWGRSGNVNGNNTWLLNDTVPSNLTGRTVLLYNASLISFFAASESADTYTLTLWEHDGVTYTSKATVSVVAARTKEVFFSGVTFTKGKELGVQVSAGSAKNVVCGIVMRGTNTP